MLVQRDGTRSVVLPAPERDVVGEAEVEEVVAGNHEEVFAVPVLPVGDEPHVGDRPEPIVVRRRAVVVDEYVFVLRPALVLARIVRVCDEVDLVDLVDFLDFVEDPVHHRPAADRQQLLRNVVGERAQTRRIARRKDEPLHTRTASDSAYGARWTPFSVTIAAISSAGVTSKAGFRAA